MKLQKITALMAAVSVWCSSLCGCTTTADTIQPIEDGILQVTYLDVGKADSILVQTASHTMVIDCGTEANGKTVVKALKCSGVTQIDYLCITHYDQDHVGGAAAVLQNFTVENVLVPNYTDENKSYLHYAAAMKQNALSPTVLTEDTTCQMEDVTIHVNVPKQTVYKNGNDNNHSLLLGVTYGETSFFFAGDAMAERLSEWEDSQHYDVLKVPYHGRNIKKLGDFLDKLTPTHAIISTSAAELSDKTIEKLKKREIAVYSTFENGTVTVISDGKEITVSCERQSS